MFDFALILVLIVLTVVLLWNFHAPFRAWMQGKSTLIETIMGGVLYYSGLLGEAAHEAINLANESGFPLPDNLVVYVPGLIIVYIIAKRLQTTTPVGG